jgi:hypothetical protein
VDPSCLALPKGTVLPARCRAANFRAQQFWRVTVDVGNRRFVARPYRAQSVLDALNQDDTQYVNPNLSAGSPVEVTVVSAKTIRFKTDHGQEMPALLDSQELLSKPEIAKAVPEAPAPAASLQPSGAKVVLLENNEFRDLEVQASKTQDIGDGAALVSFPGAASPIRAASNTPVFLVLADSGPVELSRLQVGNGTRELAVARNRSASAVVIVVTEVSATLRRCTIKDPLPPGEYVVRLQNSDRGFLFSVR